VEFKGKIVDISKDWKTGRFRVTFESMEDISKQLETITDKLLTITAKIFRNKRSRDANSYSWVLMQKIAEDQHTDKESVYLEMLGRYGVFTHIIVRPGVVDRVVSECRTVKNLGEVTVSGQTGIQLQCYFGSSTYDTKEMSVFIEGIVSECQEMGIETATPDELERMKREWGVEL
jgi:adenine C2-methylase RlmN of 23S rRNA A2503 and tRNA A37